tara:strand:- start:20863 stop:20991 length:129 start_codon:yes stop_codon:yes gene_type:complete
MNKDKKTKKERDSKYEDKLHINTSLDDVLKVSIPKPKDKKPK